MAVIPVGFGQVNLKFGGVGYPNKAEVVFGVERPSATDPAAAADIVKSWWVTYLKGRTPTAVTLESILVKWGPNSTGDFAEVGYAEPGGGSTGHVNPNMCSLVRKTTALGGRAGRGRIYYPVAEDQVGQGGALNSAEVTEGTEDFESFRTALEAADMQIVLLHATSAIAPTPVIALSVQAITATQRRRLRRS